MRRKKDKDTQGGSVEGTSHSGAFLSASHVLIRLLESLLEKAGLVGGRRGPH